MSQECSKLVEALIGWEFWFTFGFSFVWNFSRFDFRFGFKPQVKSLKKLQSAYAALEKASGTSPAFVAAKKKSLNVQLLALMDAAPAAAAPVAAAPAAAGAARKNKEEDSEEEEEDSEEAEKEDSIFGGEAEKEDSEEAENF